MIDARHRDWLRAQPDDSTPKQLAKGLRKAFGVDSEEADQIVAHFRDHRDAEIGPEEVTRILIAESQEWQRRNRIVRWTAGAGIVFVLTVAVVMFIRKGTTEDLAGLGGMIALLGIGAASTARHRLAAKAAARLRDKEALPYLFELLGSQDKEVKELAEQACIELLPQLTKEELRAVQPQQLSALFAALHATARIDLATAILGAMKANGSSSAIAPLDAFAEGRMALKAQDRERGVVLARMALGDIRLRVAGEEIERRVGLSESRLAEGAAQLPDEARHLDTRH